MEQSKQDLMTSLLLMNFLNEIASILVSEILKSIEPLKGKIRQLLQILYAQG